MPRAIKYLFTALVMTVLIVGCSGGGGSTGPKDTKLNTSSHSVNDSYWGQGEIRTDYSWRFISSTKNNDTVYGYYDEYFIDGSFIITLRNTSNSQYRVVLTKINFNDKDGYLITTNNSLGNIATVTIDAGKSTTIQDTFRIDVQSIEIANSITKISLLASITKL